MGNNPSNANSDGQLNLGPTDRWVLNGIDLTCGSRIQVNIATHWIDVVVEHDGRKYCAIPPGINLYQGMRARFPIRSTG